MINLPLRLARMCTALVFLGALSACNLGLPTPRPPQPTEFGIAPPDVAETAHPPAAATSEAGSVTDTPAALPDSAPAATDSSAPAADTPSPIIVKIFLIALEDNGGSGPVVGCGDSAVAVDVQIPPTLGVLRGALERLLSIRDQYYGGSGLYNALYASRLTVESANIDAGHAEVHLAGDLSLGGMCDDPRVEAQLRLTALQFPTVTSVSFFINGAPLSQLLSGQG